MKLASVLFGLIQSGLMSLLVSGIATFRAAGLSPDFPSLWMGGWLLAWVIAFPTVLIVAPVAHRVVRFLTSAS
jgi:hypothetical protein